MPDTTDSVFDPREEGRFIIRTDPHCHILPGLDDGARTIDMSLRMARRMVALGIENAVATPHGIHPGIDTNVHPDFIREQVARLNTRLEAEEIPLKVYPGTEVFLRRRIIQHFEKGELLTWADQGKFILLELGFQRRSSGVLEVVDYFLGRGITPIIAHPERYLWLASEPELFAEIRERGAVFQFNTMSLTGHFGPHIESLALRLIQYAGAYIIGTDSHHDSDRYFDFDGVRTALANLELLGPGGEALPGDNPSTPDLDDLAGAHNQF